MRDIQCKRCFFFTPEWCPKKRDSLDPDLIRDCEHYRVKTNGDTIRAMSDEELAKWIADIYPDCPPGYNCDAGRVTDCCDCWQDWLKQEAI